MNRQYSLESIVTIVILAWRSRSARSTGRLKSGNHSGARGYCVDTAGLDADKIGKHVKYQEEQEKQGNR